MTLIYNAFIISNIKQNDFSVSFSFSKFYYHIIITNQGDFNSILTAKKLDIELFSNDIKFQSVGKLSNEIVDFIISKKPEFNNILNSNTDVIFWEDRIKHISAHKDDFISDKAFFNCLEDIPSIIQTPDYISIHPKDNSILFIKDFSQHISVAIRVSFHGNLSIRTMYPLMDSQLSNYINKNRAWKFPTSIDKII